MIFIEIILATLAATSLMTLFSYVVSESFRELYKEPVLLEFVLSSYKLTWPLRKKRIVAWLLHYLIGFAFIVVYYLFSPAGANWYEINLTTGLLFGAICGIFGISGWAVMFRFAKREAPVKLSGYFLQLFIAHLVFGITTAFTHLAFSGGF